MRESHATRKAAQERIDHLRNEGWICVMRNEEGLWVVYATKSSKPGTTNKERKD